MAHAVFSHTVCLLRGASRQPRDQLYPVGVVTGADIWRAGLAYVDALVALDVGDADFREQAKRRGRWRSKLLHQFCEEAKRRLEGEKLQEFERAQEAWANGESL